MLDRIKVYLRAVRGILPFGHAPTVEAPSPNACQRCGGSHEVAWLAEDFLWERIRSSFDILCMDCFDALARQKGKLLLWSPERIMEGDVRVSQEVVDRVRPQ
jgi:hypothetical protein